MENRISEGKLVYFEKCTAASNISAGRMVATNTAVGTIFTFAGETTGLSGTAGAFGARFIGILDEGVSALQVGMSIWTEGIFDLQLCSGITTAATIGHPVYGAISGSGNLVGTLGTTTGETPIGTVVGRTNGTSGEYVRVKIVPGAFNWGALLSSTGTHMGNNFPPSL